jgi:hypothetical protein
MIGTRRSPSGAYHHLLITIRPQGSTVRRLRRRHRLQAERADGVVAADPEQDATRCCGASAMPTDGVV